MVYFRSFRCRHTKRDDDYQVTIQPDDCRSTIRTTIGRQTTCIKKRTSSEAAKKSRSLAVSLLVPQNAGLPEVYAPLRGAARICREFKNTPPFRGVYTPLRDTQTV